MFSRLKCFPRAQKGPFWTPKSGVESSIYGINAPDPRFPRVKKLNLSKKHVLLVRKMRRGSDNVGIYVSDGSWISQTGLGAISIVKTRNMILSTNGPLGSKMRFTREESEHNFQMCVFPMGKVPFWSPGSASEWHPFCRFIVNSGQNGIRCANSS